MASAFKVRFPERVLKRAASHEKDPSLDRWCTKSDKQTTPVDMDQILIDDFEVRRFSQKQAQIRAWELNKELNARKEDLQDIQTD